MDMSSIPPFLPSPIMPGRRPCSSPPRPARPRAAPPRRSRRPATGRGRRRSRRRSSACRIQAAASALWVELDGDGGPPLDRLLDRIEAEAGGGRFPAIVAAPGGADRPDRRAHQRPVGRAAGRPDRRPTGWPRWRSPRRGEARAPRVHDVASEPSAARLRQLSDEVSRIAATLARLSVGPGAPAANRNEPRADQRRSARRLASTRIRQVIRARRLRARYLRRGTVRRSGMGHAARPAPGGDRPASRARLLAVHRRGGAGDDRAPLDQDDDRRRPVQAPRRPA